MKKTLKICSRGHEFNKSNDCPVCPICWPARTARSAASPADWHSDAGGPGRKKKLESDFPKLAAPALRALANAKIKELSDLKKITEKEFRELHGIGPNAIKTLKIAMKEKEIAFANNK